MIRRPLGIHRRGAAPPTDVVWAPSTGITLTDAGKTAAKSGGGGGFAPVLGTSGWSSGDHYFEILFGFSGASPFALIGLSPTPPSNYPGGSDGWGYYQDTGERAVATVRTSYGSPYTNGDVIGVGYKASTGQIEFFKNGTSQGIAFTGVSGLLLPCAGIYQGGSGNYVTLRTSASEISALPSGYASWE